MYIFSPWLALKGEHISFPSKNSHFYLFQHIKTIKIKYLTFKYKIQTKERENKQKNYKMNKSTWYYKQRKSTRHYRQLKSARHYKELKSARHYKKLKSARHYKQLKSARHYKHKYSRLFTQSSVKSWG